MTEQEQTLKREIKDALNLTITNLQARQLVRFYEMLVEKNTVMNLTRITEFGEVVRKHFADSLAIVNVLSIDRSHGILDLGTGAGFPGIPLKIILPDVRMTLVDSVGKKARFVEEAAKELGFSNITVVHARAEDLARDPDYREGYDLVVSRAVANLSTLSEYCLPFVRIGGTFAAYKTGESGKEAADAERAIRLLGGSKPEILRYDLYGMRRAIIKTDKLRKTDDLFPRRAGIPSKHPL